MKLFQNYKSSIYLIISQIYEQSIIGQSISLRKNHYYIVFNAPITIEVKMVIPLSTKPMSLFWWLLLSRYLWRHCCSGKSQQFWWPLRVPDYSTTHILQLRRLPTFSLPRKQREQECALGNLFATTMFQLHLDVALEV
jgi:hypothetical protein